MNTKNIIMKKFLYCLSYLVFIALPAKSQDSSLVISNASFEIIELVDSFHCKCRLAFTINYPDLLYEIELKGADEGYTDWKEIYPVYNHENNEPLVGFNENTYPIVDSRVSGEFLVPEIFIEYPDPLKNISITVYGKNKQNSDNVTITVIKNIN